MADALISVLLDQLASVVYEHTKEAVTLILNAEKDIESFSSKLKDIQAVLEDAEKKQVAEAGVGRWLEKLKDVSYEMDNVIDEWNTEILRRQVEESENASVANKFLTKKECIITEVVQGANQKMELHGDMVRHLTLVMVPESSLSFPTALYNCKNMRSLSTLGIRTTTISPGSILQLKCLRTLNLSGNILHELPKELGELMHLRYMDLSSSQALKELPDAVCDLLNLQTLVLVWCEELEKLPKAMGKLINLKHLYVSGCRKLKYLPKGIGNLKSLQALDYFYVCDHGDEEALKLSGLAIMDQLQGSLYISNLGGNVEDAIEAEKVQLGNKKHLSSLRLLFRRRMEEHRESDEEILKALQPHQNLESLTIWNCHCPTWPLYWIKSLHNLRRVDLYDWKFCDLSPPLGKLPSLESLKIVSMNNVKKMGVEFLGIEGEIETLSREILFPKLKDLRIGLMPNWEEWEGIIKDSSEEITIMPRLSFLRIYWCPELKGLPEFLHKTTALHTLTIEDCGILERNYEKGVGKEWPNISHIPNITITGSTWKKEKFFSEPITCATDLTDES